MHAQQDFLFCLAGSEGDGVVKIVCVRRVDRDGPGLGQPDPFDLKGFQFSGGGILFFGVRIVLKVELGGDGF